MPKITLEQSPSRYEIQTRVGWIVFDIVRLASEMAKTPNFDSISLPERQPIIAAALRAVLESETDISGLDDAEIVSIVVTALEAYEAAGKAAAS